MHFTLSRYFIQVTFIIILCIFYSCKSSLDSFIHPDQKYPELFYDVQNSKVFTDDKTFPDCIPKKPVWLINLNYKKWQKNHSTGELKNFIEDNFNMPSAYSIQLHYEKDIYDHLDMISDLLIIKNYNQPENCSLILLPNDFVIPGGRFRETYYWDTYFTLLGYTALNKKDVVFKMAENFAYLIQKFGFIPNGNRSYYLSRSQPPFFSLIVELNAKLFSDSIYVHFLPEMEKEYQFWMGNSEISDKKYKHRIIVNDSIIINRYYDELNVPRVEMYNEDVTTYRKLKNEISDTSIFYQNIRSTAESGWDFSSRWFSNDTSIAGISTLSILPVDLNCLLYKLEKTISYAYSIQNDDKALLYEELANKRKNSINQLFWNDSLNFYFDYQFKEEKITGCYSLAGMFPLFFNIADSIQALKASTIIRKRFLKSGGVVTTLINSGQQWDYPNGWAPLQWITIKALENYKYIGLADTIKKRWMHLNENYFYKNHKMLEKYNVADTSLLPHDGEYPAQDGFGWTNGVYLDLLTN